MVVEEEGREQRLWGREGIRACTHYHLLCYFPSESPQTSHLTFLRLNLLTVNWTTETVCLPTGRIMGRGYCDRPRSLYKSSHVRSSAGGGARAC